MIVHIVYECTPGRFDGGVSKIAWEIAHAQSALTNTEIWTTTHELQSSVEIVEGVRIRRFPGRRYGNVIYSHSLFDELDKQTWRNECILHSHNTFHPLNLQVRYWAKRRNRPFFFHPHGAIDKPLLRKWGIKPWKKRLYWNLIELRNFNLADCIFANTQVEEEGLRYFGVRSKVQIVQNGVPRSLLSQVSRLKTRRFDYVPENDGVRVLYIGRINEKKRLLEIICEFARVLEKYPRSRLRIAGDRSQFPSYTQRIDETVKALAISESVDFLGFLDEKQKGIELENANLFVHASYSEGMAMSILEAMAWGIPTVVTQGCYMAQAANAGAVIECSDACGALTHSMIQVVESRDRGRELGRKAIEYLTLNHSWEDIARTLIDGYASDRR
jgi:glycosyltransferase involved in cell wall biosynthesis